MADRKRESIVPSGIDTSASGYAVKDGRCSVLHNMRFADGAWRNIRHFLRKLPFVTSAQSDTTYNVWRSARSRSNAYGVVGNLAVGKTLCRIVNDSVADLGVVTAISEQSGLVTVTVGGKEYTLKRNGSSLVLHGWNGGGVTLYTMETKPKVGGTIGTASNGYLESGVIEAVHDIPATSYTSVLNEDDEDVIYTENYAPSAGEMGYRFEGGAKIPYGKITSVRKFPRLTFNSHTLYLDGEIPAAGKELYELSGTSRSHYGTIEAAYTQPALYGYMDGRKVVHFPEVIGGESQDVDVYSYADSDDETQFRAFAVDDDTDTFDIYLTTTTPAVGNTVYMYDGKVMIAVDTIASVDDDGGRYEISGYSRISGVNYVRNSTGDITATHAESLSVVGHTENISYIEGDPDNDIPDVVMATIELDDSVSNDLFDSVWAFKARCTSNESLYLMSNGTGDDRTIHSGTEVYDSNTNLIGTVSEVTETRSGIYDVIVKASASGRLIELDDVVVMDVDTYHRYIFVNTEASASYDLASSSVMKVTIEATGTSYTAAYTNFSTAMAFTESITVGGITKAYGIPVSFPSAACTCIFIKDQETALNITSSASTYSLYGFDDLSGGQTKFMSRATVATIAVGDYMAMIDGTAFRTVGQVTERKNRTFHDVTIGGETIDAMYDTGDDLVVPASESYDLLYHHPAAASNRFLADKRYTSGGSTHHRLVEVEVDTTTGLLSETQHGVCDLDSSHTYTLHHFGKVLVVNDHTAKSLSYHMLVDGRYVRYDSSQYSLGTTVEYKSDEEHVKKAETAKNDISGYKDRILYVDYIYRDGEECWADHMHNYWRGELAFFAALRSPDGEILKTSEVTVINTHMLKVDGGFGFCGTYGAMSSYKDQAWITLEENMPSLTDPYAEAGSNVLSNMYIPTITISKSSAIAEGDSFVGDIAVYCTRLNRSLDTEKVISIGAAVERRNFKEIARDDVWQYFKDNDLVDQPFYLMKTFNPSEFRDGRLEVDLTYELLENLAQAKAYEATQSSDRLYAEGLLEYNNILHMYDVTTQLDFGSPFRMSGTATSYKHAVVSYTVDSVRHSAVVGGTNFAQNQGWYLIVGNNTASSVCFTGEAMGDGQYQVYGRVTLKSSDALGKAYVMNRSTSGYLPYSDIVLPSAVTEEMVGAEDGDMRYETTNRLQCSADNNCFSYPYARSYRVGRQTSRIISANSVAIEISDSKFGEYPLYVFTSEGIFAMQNGTAVLYATINPISHEVITNPRTLSANYEVLFVTRRGVMALSRKGIKALSTPLNSVSDVVPSVFTTCTMYYCPHYNEVLIPDMANSRAYVYSLTDEIWYTRDMPSMRLINDGTGILASSHATLKYNSGIYEVKDEMDTADTYGGSSASVKMQLTTRPLKFGTVELKRIETLVLRHYSPSAHGVKVTIKGGVDANTMYAVKEETISSAGDVLIRRTDASFRYLTLGIEIDSSCDVVVSCFDIEYYLRPSRRMK